MKVKVKKNIGFDGHRYITLPAGLSKKEFRELQAGKAVEVDEKFYNLAKEMLEIIKGGKNGN